MSGGYTPVFNTVFEGSLCGRYPDTAAWMFFLALADWKGEVDKTPEFIATITGMPLPDLVGCIARFMEPDSRSRSQAEEGRKLVLIDSNRDWGWRVVNIAAYREKASGRQQVADGRNAAKVKRYKERHRRTPKDTAGHPQTPTHTADSDSDSDSDKKKSKSKSALKRATRVPEGFSPDLDYARSQLPDVDADREAQKFRDWEFKTPRSDWPAVWRNWIERCRDRGEYARLSVNGLSAEFAGYTFR